MGTWEARADSDSVGTGERGSATPGDDREGADIMPDQIISASDMDDADRSPMPDEDGPHDVPDDEVIEKTLPGKPGSDRAK